MKKLHHRPGAWIRGRVGRALLGALFLAAALTSTTAARALDRIPGGGTARTTLAEDIAALRAVLRSPRLPPDQTLRLQNVLNRLERLQAEESATQSVDALLNGLRVIYRDELAKDPKSRAAILQVGRFYLFADQPDKALKYLRGAGAAAKDDLDWLLLMTSTYMRLGDYRKCDRFLQEVDQIMEQRAPLSMSKPVFVKRVISYRMYEPRDHTPQAGENVILYVELSGVQFIPTSNGLYRCNLRFGLELRDEMQTTIWSKPMFGAFSPAYRGPIRDLHVPIYYRIPNHLDPGTYTLMLTCQDRNSREEDATAVEGVDFQVGGRERIRVQNPSAADASRGAADPSTRRRDQALAETARRAKHMRGAVDAGAMPSAMPEILRDPTGGDPAGSDPAVQAQRLLNRNRYEREMRALER